MQIVLLKKWMQKICYLFYTLQVQQENQKEWCILALDIWCIPHIVLKMCFNIQHGDVYFCTADIGWITGHSYIVYGPLAAGATTLMFEGVPSYPDYSRFWQIVEKHKVNQFYTAPTAITSFGSTSAMN